MKYLLTFIADQRRMKDAIDDEMKAGMDAWKAFDQEAVDAGVLIACEPLEYAEDAITIRVGEDGDRVNTDGPFAETKEQVGGFCLIECDGLEEAIGWAKKVPLRPDSSVEVRAVMDLSPYGYERPAAEPVQHA
jgi:hypothetical protein